MTSRSVSRTVVRIGVGSTVTLAAPDETGKAVEFTVVDCKEADPTRGWVSAEAPMSRAVIGRQTGDEVVVNTPRASRRYRIVSVN